MELAIVVPLMLIFFCGIVDIGFAMTRNVILVTAASQMCVAIEEQPSMLEDMDECAAYLSGYLPGNLQPDAIEVQATPISTQQETVYEYRIWGDDPATSSRGEFKSRDTYFRYQDYTVESTIECTFFTPVGKFCSWMFNMQDPLKGYDYKVTEPVICRIDGALVGGSPW